MGEMEKKRIAWLDAVKAIGILVVLLVHTGRSFGVGLEILSQVCYNSIELINYACLYFF